MLGTQLGTPTAKLRSEEACSSAYALVSGLLWCHPVWHPPREHAGVAATGSVVGSEREVADSDSVVVDHDERTGIEIVGDGGEVRHD